MSVFETHCDSIKKIIEILKFINMKNEISLSAAIKEKKSGARERGRERELSGQSPMLCTQRSLSSNFCIAWSYGTCFRVWPPKQTQINTGTKISLEDKAGNQT